MEENKTIDEVIADAMAEEEVEKGFRNSLKNEVAQAFGAHKEEQTVTISLDEYLYFNAKNMDFDRLMSAIIKDAALSYDKEKLRISDRENIFNTIKVLFPDIYDALLKQLIKEDAEKEEDE